MKTCPNCGGPLVAAFEEHADYTVDDITEEGHIDVSGEGDMYDSELIHICCEKCNKCWYSISEFVEDVKKRKH